MKTNGPLGRLLLVGVFLLALPSVSGAQYFGKNKVQYQEFDFQVLHTRHFDIYYYPEEERAIPYAARMAERWYARHAAILRDTLHGRQPLILYTSFPQFEETNVVEGIGVGTGGVTEPALRRVVLPFAGPLAETNHVIGHELVHAFQFDISGKGSTTGGAASRMPLWFIEGMAEFLSLGPYDANTSMWMRDAAAKKIPNISDLENPEYFPYRYGESLLSFIGGTWGDSKLGDILRAADTMSSIRAAMDSTLHVSPDSLNRAWHAALHHAYDSIAHVTSKPSVYGPRLIAGNKGGGDLNVSPVLSPDGRRMIFFSTRDQFSIDMYLADARTGRVLRDIYKTALDSHLQNLEFINSAGAWDSSGRRIVFAAVRKGRPILEILDVDRDEVEREISFDDLSEIFDPVWSPDGRYIAFSAIEGGLSDLFIYDLESRNLRRLTDDAYAEFQPAWSPDGRRIAFATDRFTTKLSDLHFGNYQLAMVDVATGDVTALAGFPDARCNNPQWSPDGHGLFFISDRQGIANVYRLDLDTRHITQVTNLYGGVSGITALSPALSVARDTTRLVYSVYEEGKYSIYSIDSAAAFKGREPEPDFADGTQAILPPRQRVNPLFLANLENPLIGLPSDTSQFSTTPYSADLHLVGVGQPTVVGGVDPFGAYFGGGAALFFSDMLGNHNLATALAIESGNGTTDISALAAFTNTSHRLGWGVAGQQIPYVYGGVASGYGYYNGIPVYAEQDYIYRQIERNVSVSLSYPFSEVLRTEFSLGFDNVTYSTQILTRAVSLDVGAVVLDSSANGPSTPPINLGMASVALVYDNSLSGATSPVIGSRYRLQVSPMLGTFKLTNVLVDYRQYFMPVRPFTLAARILHYGRYGAGADDYRLWPIYLGDPGLVRGYNSGFLGGYDIASTTTANVTQVDPLFGSKILVGNLELRFPLFGALGLGEGYYGVFPIELGTFFDSGVAWSNGEDPRFAGGARSGVSSVGEAMRINLFGYAVIEVDYARRLNIEPGWQWVLNLTPGF